MLVSVSNDMFAFTCPHSDVPDRLRELFAAADSDTATAINSWESFQSYLGITVQYYFPAPSTRPI